MDETGEVYETPAKRPRIDPQQQLIQGLSDKHFMDLLSDVSKWYDERRCVNMLKEFLQGRVPNTSRFQDASSMTDLLELLRDSDDLTPTDLAILYDTVKATRQLGLQRKLRKQTPLCPNIPRN